MGDAQACWSWNAQNSSVLKLNLTCKARNGIINGVFSDYDNECRDVYHNLRVVLLAKILKATDCL